MTLFFNEMWVKSSDCYPVTPSTSPTLTDRRVAFDLKPGVSVFGGFEGTELSLNERELDLQGRPRRSMAISISGRERGTASTW